MSVVTLSVFTMSAKYPTLPPTAASLDLGVGQVATTAADGVKFPCTGKEIILVLGADADQVLTVVSVADPWLRTGNIVYTAQDTIYSVLPQIQPQGFADANGFVTITLNAGGEDVKFWCIRLKE